MLHFVVLIANFTGQMKTTCILHSVLVLPPCVLGLSDRVATGGWIMHPCCRGIGSWRVIVKGVYAISTYQVTSKL